MEDVGGGEGEDGALHLVGGWNGAVEEGGAAVVEGHLLVVVRGDYQLAEILLLGGIERTDCKGFCGDAVQLSIHKFHAAGVVVGVAAVVDRKHSAVAEQRQGGVDGIDQSAVFAQGYVEA